jgi:hypothetical protein
MNAIGELNARGLAKTKRVISIKYVGGSMAEIKFCGTLIGNSVRVGWYSVSHSVGHNWP